jgi:hypothetical protein
MGFNVKKAAQGAAKAAAPVVTMNQKLGPLAGSAADKVLGKGNVVTRALDTSSGYIDKLTGQKSKEDIARDAARDAAALKQQQLKEMPQLQNRENLDSLGAAGQFQASTVANPENSPWKQMAMKQQGLQQGMAGDALAKNNAIAAAQGRAGVAGGMGAAGGGMERAGMANMQSLAAGRQGLDATGGQQRQAIAQQAGAKGLATAQFNTGQTNQAAQANTSAQRAEANQQNAFNQLKYGEQMKFKAGQLSGDALANKGGKK